MLGIADGALEAMIARRAEMLRKGKDQSADFISKQRDRIARCFDSLERELDALDGTLTLAQISAGIACSYMDFRYPDDRWRTERPRLAHWYEDFSARPAMVRTAPAETPQWSAAG